MVSFSHNSITPNFGVMVTPHFLQCSLSSDGGVLELFGLHKVGWANNTAACYFRLRDLDHLVSLLKIVLRQYNYIILYLGSFLA